MENCQYSGLAQETASVVVRVCSRIKDATPFSLKKKDSIYLTWMLAWGRIGGLL